MRFSIFFQKLIRENCKKVDILQAYVNAEVSLNLSMTRTRCPSPSYKEFGQHKVERRIATGKGKPTKQLGGSDLVGSEGPDNLFQGAQ